jgi:hypothetical protein
MAPVPLKLMVCDEQGECVYAKKHGLTVEGSVVEVRGDKVYDLINCLENALDELEEEE